MQIGRKVFKLYLSLMLAVLVLLGQTTAFAQIDTQKLTSLTIAYKIKNNPVSGVTFNLFRVADVSLDGKYSLSGDFRDYSVSLENLNNNDKLTDLATTLSTYAERDKLKPTAYGETNSNGILEFSDYKTGLYLVTGANHTLDGEVYTIQPFVVSMPSKDLNGTWRYAVSVEPKHSKEKPSTPGGSDPSNPETPDTPGGDTPGGNTPSIPSGGGGSSTTSRTVVKKWIDRADKAEKRPEEIVAQLLRNGEVYKTAVLNEENNWTYTWKNLSRNYKWTVAEEKVPAGYTVSISQDGSLYTIINTYENDEDLDFKEPDLEEPDLEEPSVTNIPPSDNPPDDGSLSWSWDLSSSGIDAPNDNNDTVQASDNPDNISTDNVDKSESFIESLLPQTGVLWWPVGVLFILGLIIFIVGYRYRSKNS